MRNVIRTCGVDFDPDYLLHPAVVVPDAVVPTRIVREGVDKRSINVNAAL